jgi:hypothetical protein
MYPDVFLLLIQFGEPFYFYLLIYFGRTGDWTQGLMLAGQPLLPFELLCQSWELQLAFLTGWVWWTYVVSAVVLKTVFSFPLIKDNFAGYGRYSILWWADFLCFLQYHETFSSSIRFLQRSLLSDNLGHPMCHSFFFSYYLVNLLFIFHIWELDSNLSWDFFFLFYF